MSRMRTHTGREWSGPAGTAIEVIIDRPARPDQTATLASWFLTCPGQSPAWENYALSIIHLRPIDGVRAAHVRVPHATHEVLLLALDPTRKTTSDPNTWRFLRPYNLMEQIELPSDEAAVELLELAVRAVLDGRLWAEAPLSGQVEPWRTVLIKTSAHARGEEHAP